METGGNEGKRDDLGGDRLAAHHELHRRTDGGAVGLDVAHGDGTTDRGAEAAGGDDADGRAGGIQHLGAVAGRRLAGRADADALAADAFGELLLDDGGAGKAAFGAAALLDRPDKPAFDRRRGGVDVVTVEAETALEAQRVAGAEADGLDAGVDGSTAFRD